MISKDAHDPGVSCLLCVGIPVPQCDKLSHASHLMSNGKLVAGQAKIYIIPWVLFYPICYSVGWEKLQKSFGNIVSIAISAIGSRHALTPLSRS